MTKEEIESEISQLEDEIGELQDQIEVYNGMLKEIENEEKQKNTKEQEPCEDAISRRAVIDTLDTAEKFLDEDRTVERYKDMLTAACEVLPPVTPKEPKTGHWISMEVSSGRDSWKCSVCGRRARGKLKNLPYCHCGTKMESEG